MGGNAGKWKERKEVKDVREGKEEVRDVYKRGGVGRRV